MDGKVNSLMKTLAFFLLLLSLTSLRAQIPAVGTAAYYMMQPEKWVDKPVTLSVAYVVVSNDGKVENGFRHIQAMTFANHQNGGIMSVFVVPAALPRVIQLCGTTQLLYSSYTMPHTIQGKFKKVGEQYAVVIEK